MQGIPQSASKMMHINFLTAEFEAFTVMTCTVKPLDLSKCTIKHVSFRPLTTVMIVIENIINPLKEIGSLFCIMS